MTDTVACQYETLTKSTLSEGKGSGFGKKCMADERFF